MSETHICKAVVCASDGQRVGCYLSGPRRHRCRLAVFFADGGMVLLIFVPKQLVWFLGDNYLIDNAKRKMANCAIEKHDPTYDGSCASTGLLNSIQGRVVRP